MDGSLVGTWSTLVDVPAGNDTMATVEFPLEDGDYVFRTLVDYPRMNVNNTSMGHMVLASHQHTVHTSVLGSSGGWGMGLLLLLIAIGAAVLYWAYKKGLWRPGRAYQKVMSRVSPDPEA